MKTDLATRFWSKVTRPSIYECWLWTGAHDGRGYGNFRQFSGVTIKTHRMAWILLNGDIPSHLEVRHQCFNKLCCNPKHLLLGTHKENGEDSSRKMEMVCGSSHRCAKLNESKVKEMRLLYATGALSYEKIANMYGVTICPAYMAINRKTWKHVK